MGDAIREQFKARAEKFDDSANWIKDRGLLELHYRLAKRSKDSKALDLCCGTGVVGEKFFGKVGLICGVDISLEMLKYAQKRINYCINAQAELLPFKDRSFDIVICRQAFHFLELKKVIFEIHRILKKEGRIIVSQIVPFGEDDKRWLYKIHTAKQPALKNFLEEKVLVNLLNSTGYIHIRSHHYYLKESINRWLKFTPELSAQTVLNIKEMFYNAPLSYKQVHETEFLNGDIIDKMKWVVVTGQKK